LFGWIGFAVFKSGTQSVGRRSLDRRAWLRGAKLGIVIDLNGL
jgi:hypothetical protein